jgi:formamidopyrimidine-DNA glycosylase
VPELPDVVEFQQRFEAAAAGRRIDRVHVHDAKAVAGISAAALAKRLRGMRLAGSRRHGKYLGIALDRDAPDAPHLILHFGMTGDLRGHGGDEPPRHARLTLDLDNRAHLTFLCRRKLCRARLAESFDEFVAAQGLGPDALGDALDEERFQRLLEGRRGTVKSVLMKQSLLAGIGNEYADEILFHARIHPATPTDRLDSRARARLWRTLRRILSQAAARGGRTEALPRGWLKAQRKKGAQCPRCGTNIEHGQIAGRSTYHCPRCQPPPG